MKNVLVRKMTRNDDFTELARLLYLADPYTYPAWFKFKEDLALKAIIYLAKDSDIFSFHNTLIALNEDGVLAGALLYIKKSNHYDLEVFNTLWAKLNEEEPPAHALTIEGYIKEIVKFTSDYYLLNIAVNPIFQGQGIAQNLLTAFDKEVVEGTISLEVVSENVGAIHLYKKEGYVINEEFPTFCLTNDTYRSYHMVKKL